MDKATLTLGDNRRVDFSQSLVFLTSNLGSEEMTKLIHGGMGYTGGARETDEELDQKIYRTATEAAQRKFSPEFMNRLDKVIVFRTLNREHLEKILDIELKNVQERIISSAVGKEFVFNCTPRARHFLLDEGTDSKFGARHLKRSIERHLVFPLSNLLAKENFRELAGTTFEAAPAVESFASVCDAGARAAAALAAASDQSTSESRRTIRKKQRRAGEASGPLSSALPSESISNN